MQQILARQWVLHGFGKAEAGLELQAVSVTAPLPMRCRSAPPPSLSTIATC